MVHFSNSFGNLSCHLVLNFLSCTKFDLDCPFTSNSLGNEKQLVIVQVSFLWREYIFPMTTFGNAFPASCFCYLTYFPSTEESIGCILLVFHLNNLSSKSGSWWGCYLTRGMVWSVPTELTSSDSIFQQF